MADPNAQPTPVLTPQEIAALEAAKAAVPTLDTKAIGDLNESIKSLLTLASQRQSPPESTKEEPEEEVDPVELEAMPRAQFAQHLLEKILTAINKQVVSPLNQRLNEITASTSQQSITSEVMRLGGEKQSNGLYKGGKYPDFWDFKDEMLSLAREPGNQGLAPERLYRLAKVEYPEKATEIAKKYKTEAPEGVPKKIKLGFGGLTPGQSGTGSRAGKMNGSEAANAAWSETVAALGGTPDFGDDD